METVTELCEDQKPDFCVTINFKKGSPNPERLFRMAAAYIEALQGIDAMLVQSIDSKIKPVLLLEEIEAGSVKVWLKEFLEAIDDEALKKIDWKPAVGKYLVQGKHLLLTRLGAVKKLESREMLEQIAADVNRLARETDVLHMPAYRPVSAREIAYGAKLISDATAQLKEGESVSLVSDLGEAPISQGLAITQEQIDELLAAEVIENTTTRILMVRRPDFLGDASWEFRYEKRRFDARIEDTEWMAKFRAGEVDIRPGDALKVEVFERAVYDRNGEVLGESRIVRRVLGIIRELQTKLPA